jgi:hypothetical protein
MHRTEGQYNAANLFTDGPPGTRCEENWLNAIQEEIAKVITDSGAALLTAGTETRAQLSTAIQALIASEIEIVNDVTPQLGGDLDSNGNQMQWSKGADVASAAALPILTDGNYFDVTGVATITSINTTGRIGTVIKLHFDGTLILTHHATDLILPGAANVSTAAGDEAEFIEYASGDWRCTNYQVASFAPGSGVIVQQVNVQTGAVATGATVMPHDDTIPDIAEGDEYMTLAITPTSAANKLKIDVVMAELYTSAAGGVYMGVALFQDATGPALASSEAFDAGATPAHTFSFTHYMTSGTTSSTTFRVRAGASGAGTTTFNGVAAGRIHGGAMASSITITEIKV